MCIIKFSTQMLVDSFKESSTFFGVGQYSEQARSKITIAD